MKQISIIFVLFAILIVSKTALAQQFNAGFRLGVNACQIDGDQMSGYNMGGLVAGMFVSYPFKHNLEGQFEMLFSQKGSQRIISDSFVQPGLWDLFRINYIEVPVMINYRWGKKIKLSGGIGGAFMLSNHFIGLNNEVFDNIDNVTKGELSGTAGFQYYILPKFSLYARFTYSLLGINNHGSNTAFYVYDGGMANNVLSFGAYYSFLSNYRP